MPAFAFLSAASPDLLHARKNSIRVRARHKFASSQLEELYSSRPYKVSIHSSYGCHQNSTPSKVRGGVMEHVQKDLEFA